MKLIPITYHNKKYPCGIISTIDEIAGNLDKDNIKPTRNYSLHTEYSHIKRKLENNLINKYEELKKSHKDNIPQLWKNKKWAIEFANFIIDLIGNNVPPTIIEIHPPFNDYCGSFKDFFDIYREFEKIILKKYPNVTLLIENRCGSFYKGGKFIISNSNSIINFLEELEKQDLKLKLVLDYPQVFSADLIKMDSINLTKILNFNEKIKKYINNIGGFHLWGKKKSMSSNRWTPHNGDLNSFFSNNESKKEEFIKSILDTFSDDKKRYFVPEVNSSEEDLQSIINDLIKYGIEFE